MLRMLTLFWVSLDQKMSKVQILRELRTMDIRLTSKMKVYYEHLLRAITTRSIVVDLRDVQIEEYKAQHLTPYTLAHWYASGIIQRHWRHECASIKLYNAQKYNVRLCFYNSLKNLFWILRLFYRTYWHNSCLHLIKRLTWLCLMMKMKMK